MAKFRISVTEIKIATLYSQRTAENQGISYFSSCRFVNLLYRRSSNSELCPAVFLTESFFVDQAKRLIFVYCQNDGFTQGLPRGKEFESLRKAAHSATFCRS